MNLKGVFDRLPGPLRMPLAALVVFCTYYLGAKLGLSLTFKPDFIAAFWPPNAIILAALLLSPARAWWWFILAMIPAELAADLPAGMPLRTALAFVTVDALEVLLAASLLRRLAGMPLLFNTLRQTVTYLLVAVLLAPAVSGFAWSAYSVLMEDGSTFWGMWRTWFLGDALTHFTLTPFILLWFAGELPGRAALAPRRVIEGVALSSLLLGGIYLSFGGGRVYGWELSALSHAPLPLLLWTALRFGPRATFTAALFITLASVWSASHGYGPFTSLSPDENVVDLQTYLLFALSPLLLLSVIVEERRRALDAVSESEEKFRLLFNSGSDAIFVHEVTPDGMPGKFVEVNDVACRRLGYTREELLRLSPPDIDKTVDRAENSEVVEKVLTERTTIFERVHMTKDGRPIPVEINTSFFDVDGRPLMLSLARDVTERKRVEEVLRKAKDDLEMQNMELKKLDLMKDGLIRDVSHELKTPVAKHRMQMEILGPAFREHSLSEEEEKALRVMEESIRRQESVIRNLLNVSRLESGGRQYRREPVDLAGIFDEIRQDYQYAIETYNVDVEIDVPAITLSSDGEMLWHLLSNLVNNAIKFSSQSAAPRVVISADVREEALSIRIEDNGVGIGEEDLKMVFTRFYQASASSEGSGVGLSICRMIAEGLGGTIRVESDGVGEGASAILSFPWGPSRPSPTG